MYQAFDAANTDRWPVWSFADLAQITSASFDAL